MKTIIAGSRGVTQEKHLFCALECFQLDNITEVVSGGAKGADRLGEVHAKCMALPLTVKKADWDLYGKSAGIIRNKEMGDYADQLLALWDGESKGTLHMINYMKKLGKPVYVYNTKELLD